MQALLPGCEARSGTRRPPRVLSELIVDNFAGGGGASMGIEMALGRGVDIAINHDLDAIGMHQTNHPHARHYHEDVWAIDPLAVTLGVPVGLAWFSPDCRHFSRAKGGKPVKKNIRGLAWIVLRWAASARPRVIILENVREFQEWGPLNRNHRPIRSKIGTTFHRWVQQLRDLGYAVEWKALNAADYGAPTLRRRLFVIARCDGQPIVWPEPTHGPGSYRTAAECIDWNLPTPSIYGRKKPLSAKTMRRIEAGLKRYVLDNPAPFVTEPIRTVVSKNEHILCTAFLVKYNGTALAVPVTDPLHTVTSKARFALITVAGTRYKIADIGMRMLTPRELARCQGFPDEYVLTGTDTCKIAKIGNSVSPPVAAALVRANVVLGEQRRVG